MTSLQRTVFGTTFQNPLLLAAGTAGFGRELAGTIDLDLIGGLVTKAVSLRPRDGNPPPRVTEFRGGMLNAVGLANPGLAVVLERELPWLMSHCSRARIVVNVVGFEEWEYAEVIKGLEGVEGISAFELNLSCPNTAAGGVEFGVDPEAVSRIVAACRLTTPVPLLVKLSPVSADLPHLARTASAAGADGVTLINTMPGWLGRGDGEPVLGNGFGGVSGPALLPIGIAAVRRVRAALPDFPIVGVGGVRSVHDVIAYQDAGADLIGIGTGALATPRLPERIVRDLDRAQNSG